MEQPLLSCTRCMKSFPTAQMSRSGSTCKNCSAHHSSFKQCEFCRSDFKQSISGSICPRCQSLKAKYGDPKPCTICQLPMSFGSALVCQRCLHYRNKFGDPRQCENCLRMCAFYKDEASRNKVDGQVLCWVCTYNYKVSKSRERSERHHSKRHSYNDSYFSKSNDSLGLNDIKRQRTEEYANLHSSNANYSMDSAYNEHLVQIGQLQEEVVGLRRQLAQKHVELLAKEKEVACLKSDLADFKALQRQRELANEQVQREEIQKLKETIRALKREKAEILASRSSSARRHRSGAGGLAAPLPPPAMALVRSAKTSSRRDSSTAAAASAASVPGKNSTSTASTSVTVETAAAAAAEVEGNTPLASPEKNEESLEAISPSDSNKEPEKADHLQLLATSGSEESDGGGSEDQAQ